MVDLSGFIREIRTTPENRMNALSNSIVFRARVSINANMPNASVQELIKWNSEIEAVMMFFGIGLIKLKGELKNAIDEEKAGTVEKTIQIVAKDLNDVWKALRRQTNAHDAGRVASIEEKVKKRLARLQRNFDGEFQAIYLPMIRRHAPVLVGIPGVDRKNNKDPFYILLKVYASMIAYLNGYEIRLGSSVSLKELLSKSRYIITGNSSGKAQGIIEAHNVDESLSSYNLTSRLPVHMTPLFKIQGDQNPVLICGETSDGWYILFAYPTIAKFDPGGRSGYGIGSNILTTKSVYDKIMEMVRSDPSKVLELFGSLSQDDRITPPIERNHVYIVPIEVARTIKSYHEPKPSEMAQYKFSL